MAYIMFTAQKLSLTNRIFSLQMQLNDIMEERQRILDVSATIADGVITTEELANDPLNLQDYMEFNEAYVAYRDNSSDTDAANAIIDRAVDDGADELYVEEIENIVNTRYSEAFAKYYQRHLDAQDHRLEMQQKKIETQLTAAQNNLKSVEEAEQKGIENSAPKYNGIG